MSHHIVPTTDISIREAPDCIDPELAPLIDSLAESPALVAHGDGTALRARLLGRISASALEAAPMRTTRRRHAPRDTLAPGIVAQALYTAAAPSLRPGEPLRARLLEIDGGTSLHAALLGDAASFDRAHREWLVLRGELSIGGQVLGARDYCVMPAGLATPAILASSDATVFLRESRVAASAGDAMTVIRDAEAGWPDFAPGIQRRVLWERDGEAALLYYAQPGAKVPLHSHGHDEECFTVQGELFLDDVLLQAGDYQLAPVGTGHRVTETDTGVVIYAHGDLDLRFAA